VRGMAVWALGRLCSESEFNALAAPAVSQESDRDVQAEWRAALVSATPAPAA